MAGPFWSAERQLVEQFTDLPFPFHKIELPKFEMMAHRSLEHLLGYLRTWSSTQRFIAAKGTDPLEQIIDELRTAWDDSQQTRDVTWPLVLRVGIKDSGESPKE